MNRDYGTLTLVELKAELKKRNAKIGGKKAILVARLLDYDKNSNFNYSPVLEEAYEMFVPEHKLFADINSNSDLPCFTQECFDRFGVGHTKNVAKSQNMYEDKYLLSVRSAIYCGDTFILGRCASEYRKSVTYVVHVKYTNNVIYETQCECAAGLAPDAHCKHVFVVLRGLLEFGTSKSIAVRDTCTSQLQSFHVPKKYCGRPVEAKELKLKKKKVSQELLNNFDPRPITMRMDAGYKSVFNNLAISYCARSNCKHMPIMEIIPPADKRAASIDHNYLKENVEEDFLSLFCKSGQEIKTIEIQTRGQAHSSQWFDERNLRLQSSNFGKICKVTERANKEKIAESFLKTTLIKTPAIMHGVKYEPTGINAFEIHTGLKSTQCGIVIHPLYQFLGSSPDGLIGDDAVLEVKCPYSAKDEYISAETVPYLYLCEVTGSLTLNKRHDYFFQVQGQLLCSGRIKAYFVVFTLKDFLIIKIERDNHFIERMLERLIDFYNNYFKHALVNKYVYNDYEKFIGNNI